MAHLRALTISPNHAIVHGNLLVCSIVQRNHSTTKTSAGKLLPHMFVLCFFTVCTKCVCVCASMWCGGVGVGVGGGGGVGVGVGERGCRRKLYT